MNTCSDLLGLMEVTFCFILIFVLDRNYTTYVTTSAFTLGTKCVGHIRATYISSLSMGWLENIVIDYNCLRR